MSTFCCSRRRRRPINNLYILLDIAGSRSGLKNQVRVHLCLSSTAAVYKRYIKSRVWVIFDAAILSGTVSLCRCLWGGHISSRSAGAINGRLKIGDTRQQNAPSTHPALTQGEPGEAALYSVSF